MLLRHHAQSITTSSLTHRVSLPQCAAPFLYLPSPFYPTQRRRQSSKAQTPSTSSDPQTSPPKNHVAVLGGGITGLTTAYLLAEVFPNLGITLFENKSILGGWVRSKKVDVPNGEAIFEQGPRSLRPQAPNGTLALRMIQDLGLTDDLIFTTKESTAARNRFVYYPNRLVRMPGPRNEGVGLLENAWKTGYSLFTEPVFKDVVFGIAKESAVEPRSKDVEDESVGQFVSRRFGSEAPANNLVSAVFHGIYAGDIWKLSAKSLIPSQWLLETKLGSISNLAYQAVVEKQSWGFCDDMTLNMSLQEVDWDSKIKDNIGNASVFTFKHGLGQLTEAMIERLDTKSNVEIRTDTTVTDIERQKDTGDLNIQYSTSRTTPQTTKTFTHAISTMAPRNLTPLLTTPPHNLSALDNTIAEGSAVTVLVVNLYFKTPELLTWLKPPGGFPRVPELAGFGYLIPRSIPFAQNPERALGVIFDSDVTPDLWTSVPPDENTWEGGPGTKLTVMMGGHWWDGWTEFPEGEEAKLMARSVLKRHLGIEEVPVVCEANLQRGCIPQYHVGHSARMSQAHDALVEGFGDRLRVAGSWYSGVGVNDCLRGAWDLVAGMAADLPSEETAVSGLGLAVRGSGGGREKRFMRGKRTGLENFKTGRPMVLSKKFRGKGIGLVEVEKLGREMGFFEMLKLEGENEGKEESD